MTCVVEKHLKIWRENRFSYENGHDCLVSLANYLIDCGYPDFALKFRNTYSSKEEAFGKIKQYGGEFEIIEETGLKRTNEPKFGDIVLVKFSELISGLYLDDKIAFRSENGLVQLNKKFVKIKQAWSVERCHQ